MRSLPPEWWKCSARQREEWEMEEVSSVEWIRGTQCGARSRCHHLNSISPNPSFQPPTTGIIARPRITILHSIPLSVNVYESNSTAIFSLSSGRVACLPAPLPRIYPRRRRRRSRRPNCRSFEMMVAPLGRAHGDRACARRRVRPDQVRRFSVS